MTDLLEREKSRVAHKEIPQVSEGRIFGPILNPLRFALDSFGFMQELKQRYGEIVSMKGAVLSYTFLFTPELTRQVLTDTSLFHNGEISDYPFQVPENSPLSRMTRTLNAINGDSHRQQRKLMMPAFHRKRVESYRDDMVRLTGQRLDEWEKLAGEGQPLNILQEMKQLTLTVALKTLLGLEANDHSEKLRKVVERWLAIGAKPAAFLLPFNLPGLPYRNLVELAGEVETEFKQLIERKRQLGPGNDVLSMLIEARDEETNSRLSENELISQSLALFVAGHETTATALTWTLFLLSQHPQIVAALVAELEENLQGDAPTLEQINQLDLLDRIIKESMRILSPFVWGMRFPTRDCDLGGYAIKKGTPLVFAPAIIHHEAQIFPEPKLFKPERWETRNPATYEYLPFAAGPRMCIGATFATLEMKIVLAMLLQRYRLSLAPGARIDRAGMLLTYPKQGMPMQIFRQDYKFSQNPAIGNIQQVVKLG